MADNYIGRWPPNRDNRKCLHQVRIIGSDCPEEGRWFQVLKKSAVPIMIGLQYITKTSILTKIRHLLVDCPLGFMKAVSMLKYMGSQAVINFEANGRPLVGCAETRSDLNFMSLECAIKKGVHIDRRPGHRTKIMLPDESKVKTVGTVNISRMEIDGFDPIPMTFHILAGLPFDVIFGDEFLEDIDAFNTCCKLRMLDVEYPDLNTLINLGPLQAWDQQDLGQCKKKPVFRLLKFSKLPVKGNL
jgi:hypothetical protein